MIDKRGHAHDSAHARAQVDSEGLKYGQTRYIHIPFGC